LNSYIRFNTYKEYSLYETIQEIRKARVGYVFRFEHSDDFYTYSEFEKTLKVGDSVAKPPLAKEIEVYRFRNERYIFYKSFEIIY